MNHCIVGWAHTPFGKLEERRRGPDRPRRRRRHRRCRHRAPTRSTASSSACSTTASPSRTSRARCRCRRIDALRFKPATRYENACASGSAAIHGARDFLAAGRGRFALVIGVEKMTATPAPQVGDNLLGACYRRRRATSRPGSPACSAASPSATSSATATSPTRSPRSPPRTTRTASTTPTRRCARTSATSSAAPSARRTPTWRRR